MRQLKYSDYYSKLLNSNIKRGSPTIAEFELTYNCNLQCVHCYVVKDKDRKELTTKQVFSILKVLAEIGIIKIVFTGGEPFIRKDILEILLYSKRQGFDIVVYTNGTLITERIADTLIKNGIKRFDISFHSTRPEIFEKITQVKGSYEKVISNVRMLKKKGALIKLKPFILNINLEDIFEVGKFAKSLEVGF